MQVKFIKESLEDILKPKQIIGKIFYAEGAFSSVPPFAFKILNMGKMENIVYEEVMTFECEVVFNKHLIEGSQFFSLDVGGKFNLDEENFSHFKELDGKPIEKMNKQIHELETNKKYFEKLLNES
jgi:hypothetical protein